MQRVTPIPLLLIAGGPPGQEQWTVLLRLKVTNCIVLGLVTLVLSLALVHDSSTAVFFG